MPRHAWRQQRLNSFHLRLDRFHNGIGVGGWQLINANCARALAISGACGVVLIRAQFSAANVANAHHRAVGATAHNDVAKLLFAHQAALGDQCQIETRIAHSWTRTNTSNGRLLILILDSSGHIVG